MGDDYDDFDEGGGGGSGSHEVGFFDDTEGALVAGRSFEMSGMPRSELGKLKLAVEALGKGITVVPAGDLTDTGPGADEDCWGSGVIGILHGSGGGYGPEPVTREKCLAKLEAAKALGPDVWKSVNDLLPEKNRERFGEEEVHFFLVPVGPLAAAKIAFGKVGVEEDPGQGEFFWGTDMSQEKHQQGVWGVRVCSGEDPVEVDLSESAHQARVAAHPDGGYFLIARYD
ncbi:MAG: hypothetical protein JNM17_20025 [Archangium sp.]|nr:hypothetical protein [Archangium sp.]